MADFFARLAARLLDEDTARLRPNLSTRFAPAPEIWPHAAAGIPSPPALPRPSGMRLPAPARRRLPAPPGGARQRGTGRVRPRPPGGACPRQPAAAMSPSAALARCDSPPDRPRAKGKQAESRPVHARCPPCDSGDDSRPIPADPTRKSAGAAAPERESVLLPGKSGARTLGRPRPVSLPRRPESGQPGSRRSASLAGQGRRCQPGTPRRVVPGPSPLRREGPCRR